MHQVIIETSRLYLRELTPIDAPHFFMLNQNPNVIRYTGDKAFSSEQAARNFLENYQDYKRNGYGRWAVILQSSNTFIGWCGLKLGEIENETDIGFRFFEHEWNKGYATEAAKACLDYGFHTLKLRRIIGRAMKDNIASIKVLEKIGLTFDKDVIFDGEEGVIYKIEFASREENIHDNTKSKRMT